MGAILLYGETTVMCEIWLCVDCAGFIGTTVKRSNLICPCHPSTIFYG
jgi:hypothetical protein